ncbi:hypothetical protein VNI00_013157 [Paramarasmius palmivorus]|uniref:Uncharacterized protein n=1 Tax=Paramarasmius palmivorus TaxID=297713 RepID=A0AAW0BZ76_9AGAR
MSASKFYVPESVDSELLRSRASPDGVYDRLVKWIVAQGRHALANAEMGTDFRRGPPTGPYGNHSYIFNGSNSDFKALVVGEIVGSGFGTRLGATGSHYISTKDTPEPIKDSTKIRSVIVLARPSYATPALQQLWDNQLATLAQIRMADHEAEKTANKKFDSIKEISKPLGDDGAKCIVLHGPNLYTIHQESNDARPFPSSTIKRSLSEANGTPSEIALGDLYDPSVLPDYGGSLFQHRRAKVIQPDYRDGRNKKLLHPANWWSDLRPGTLVAVTAEPTVIIVGKERARSSSKKIYHADIVSLLAMAPSDVEVEKPEPLQGVNAIRTSSSTDDASTALLTVDFLTDATPVDIGNDWPPSPETASSDAIPSSSPAKFDDKLDSQSEVQLTGPSNSDVGPGFVDDDLFPFREGVPMEEDAPPDPGPSSPPAKKKRRT